ncbi:MAG: hypothetical protein ACUVV4_01310 [Candidatus Bathyarchaeia archaeon]
MKVRALRRFKETLKEIRHEKTKPKFCPVCNSHKLDVLLTIGITPSIYVCRECGYKGVLVVELEESHGR